MSTCNSQNVRRARSTAGMRIKQGYMSQLMLNSSMAIQPSSSKVNVKRRVNQNYSMIVEPPKNLSDQSFRSSSSKKVIPNRTQNPKRVSKVALRISNKSLIVQSKAKAVKQQEAPKTIAAKPYATVRLKLKTKENKSFISKTPVIEDKSIDEIPITEQQMTFRQNPQSPQSEYEKKIREQLQIPANMKIISRGETS